MSLLITGVICNVILMVTLPFLFDKRRLLNILDKIISKDGKLIGIHIKYLPFILFLLAFLVLPILTSLVLIYFNNMNMQNKVSIILVTITLNGIFTFIGFTLLRDQKCQ